MKQKTFIANNRMFSLIDYPPSTPLQEGFILLKGISEQQAGELVDETYIFKNHPDRVEFRYRCYDGTNVAFRTATQSLLSLLSSEGVILFVVPADDPGLMPSPDLYRFRELKERTFLNPVIKIH